MPLVFEPVNHNCLRSNQYDVTINQTGIKSGTIWKCPDCGRLWERIPPGAHTIAVWERTTRFRLWWKVRTQRWTDARNTRRRRKKTTW